MINSQDQDFYNMYRLLGCGHSEFREIFQNYLPQVNYSLQEIRWLAKTYREKEKELKIAHEKKVSECGK